MAKGRKGIEQKQQEIMLKQHPLTLCLLELSAIHLALDLYIEYVKNDPELTMLANDIQRKLKGVGK